LLIAQKPAMSLMDGGPEFCPGGHTELEGRTRGLKEVTVWKRTIRGKRSIGIGGSGSGMRVEGFHINLDPGARKDHVKRWIGRLGLKKV